MVREKGQLTMQSCFLSPEIWLLHFQPAKTLSSFESVFVHLLDCLSPPPPRRLFFCRFNISLRRNPAWQCCLFESFCQLIVPIKGFSEIRFPRHISRDLGNRQCGVYITHWPSQKSPHVALEWAPPVSPHGSESFKRAISCGLYAGVNN